MGQRRSKGDGSVSQRKDGKWLAQIVIGYDANGKLKKKSRVAKTKSEAGKFSREMQLEKQKNTLMLQGKMAFSELLARWLELKKGQLKAKSYMDYERICKCQFLPKFGRMKMEKIKGVF